MRAERTALRGWDALHKASRHQLRHPSEHVVRWLSSMKPRRNQLALDIGCGNGRHLKLLEQYGYLAVGVDSSREAAAGCKLSGTTQVVLARSQDLPFTNESFKAALAYGVFYYGTRRDADHAIAEMRRVLKPGGHAFVVVRTNFDWRFAHLEAGVLDIPGEPEHGMPMHFLDHDDIDHVYRAFAEVRYELTETTTHARARVNSDWLITLTK